MPLYEYECDDCGRRFELIRKFSDPPVTTCPTCDGSVQKLVSSPAIQFKGTGWYITDYARKPSGGQAAAEKAAGDSKDAGKGKSSSEGEKSSSEGKTKPDASSPASKSGTRGSSSTAGAAER